MALLRLFVFLIASRMCVAWIMDPDCEPWKYNVTRAMTSWEKMVTFGIARASDPKPGRRSGEILQDMLGATSEDDPVVLAQVIANFKAAQNTVAARYTRTSGLIIHCTDSYLAVINPVTGEYRDNSPGLGNPQVNAPRQPGVPLATGVTNACAGQVEAFAYTYGNAATAGSGAVIVLCSDWQKSALQGFTRDNMETHRLNELPPGFIGMGVDFVSGFLSYKLAHEVMHASNMLQFPAILPDRDSGGNVVGELYGYAPITGNPVGVAIVDRTNPVPSANNRQHNADSYALLMSAWYFRGYKFENGGQPVLIVSGPRPPAVYPTTAVASRRRDQFKRRQSMPKLDMRELQVPLISNILTVGSWPA